MSALRMLAAVLACALGSAACTHTMEVRSEPPGAEVIFDGEPVGTTPLVLERTSSHADMHTLVVRYEGEEARLAVLEEGWAAEPIVLSVVAALGLGGFGFGVGVVGYVGILLFAISNASDPAVLAAGILGSLGLFFVGALLGSVAPHLPFIGAGEFARVGPDEVLVDFTNGEVWSSPPGQLKPLVGVSEGYRPLRAGGDGSATPSTTGAPPSPRP